MTDTPRHPEPVDLADVAREIDELHAGNARLLELHYRLTARAGTAAPGASGAPDAANPNQGEAVC